MGDTMQRIKAFAPATVANLGVGFDVLGLAVTAPGDFVTVEKRPESGVEVVEITGDDGRLSYDPDENTAAIAAQSTLRMIGTSQGVRLWLEKGLPLASGLGSSAASAVAAAVATNVLFGGPLNQEDLLSAALDAEAVVSGRHADNVAPALYGGIVLITGLTPGEIHRLPIPDGIYLSLVTPGVEVPTAEARAVLPKTVPLTVLVHQTGVIAELVHALHQGNVHLLAQSMQRDAVVEPARASLIPGLEEAREIAMQYGALVMVISGAGPTLCSLCVTMQDAEAVSHSLMTFYDRLGIGAKAYETVPAKEGARVVE
jgi:homoserine kinase